MRKLDIPASTEKLPEVLAFVSDNLSEMRCSSKERTQIEIAVEEIFTNIASYAYSTDGGTATVRVELVDEPLSVCIDFIDDGVPYDPLAKADPNTKLALDKRQRGGLGIFMTKKYMDSVEYSYKDGRNVLTLRKRLLRQPEVDFAKAVLIFFLATIHCFVECSTDEQLWHGLPYFFDSVLGGPWAAPMFIFSMGIGLAFTTKNKAEDLITRGLGLLVTGVVLNTFRFAIPSILGYLITDNRAFYLDMLPYRFFGNDLLQFAGLAMILMGFLKHLKLTTWKIFFVALGLNIVFSIFLNNLWFSNNVVNVLLGHIVGVDDGTELVVSDFPLFIWFLLYASGLVFGEYLKTMKNKKKFYMWVSLPCFVVSVAVYIIEYHFRFGMMGGPGANVFYHLTTPELFICIATEFAMLGFYYFICSKLPRKVNDLIERISRNVTNVYIIQWVLVWWVANFFIYIIRGDKYLPEGITFVIGLVLSFASVALAFVWQEYKERKNGQRV